MMTKILKGFIFISLIGLQFSCSKPASIYGRFEGAWKTEWKDDLSGSLDEISIEEIILFENDENLTTQGTFYQYFSGSVEYDDWINETEIEYQLAVEGTWTLKGENNIILKYNMNSLEAEFGKSNISKGGDDGFVDFMRGDWAGLLSDAIKSDSESKKINKKVDSEVSKQVSSFFKEMFMKMNKNKEAMKNIVIDDDIMTCEINHGFFGRDATYYRLDFEASNFE